MKEKQQMLCGRCIYLYKEHFDVKELGRREKIDCGHCGKRRYGAKVELTKKKK